MMRKVLLGAALLAVASGAGATTRAELRSTQVAAGQPVVLTITTDAVQPPDYGPLRAGFAIDDVSVERSFGVDSSGVSLQQRYVVTLTPRGSGTVIIPSLVVGSDRTQPLALEVAATGAASSSQAPMPGTTSGRGPVFVQAAVDDVHPYVQQTVGMTVRLYYATQLVSGQLDVPAPEGASLVQMGEDSRGTQQVDGRTYGVIERHYQVVPERSGAVTLPAPRFSGAGEGGLLDQVFGDGREDLRASGQPVVLQVRPIPPSAPQPWLPLHALSMRMSTMQSRAKAGETFVVSLHVQADGATAAQLPALMLETSAGSQVFPNSPQLQEGDRQGRPYAAVDRGFSILPGQAGTFRVHALPITWWNVDAARAEVATAPDLVMQVAQGVGSPAAPSSPDGSVSRPRIAVPNWSSIAAVLLGGAVLVLLAMLLRSRRPVTPATIAAARSMPVPAPPSLKDALGDGRASGIAEALQREAGVAGLDAVHDRLADTAQADAVAQLQRVLWHDGDSDAAIRELRAVFQAGAKWRIETPRSGDARLPPLYPER